MQCLFSLFTTDTPDWIASQGIDIETMGLGRPSSVMRTANGFHDSRNSIDKFSVLPQLPSVPLISGYVCSVQRKLANFARLSSVDRSRVKQEDFLSANQLATLHVPLGSGKFSTTTATMTTTTIPTTTTSAITFFRDSSRPSVRPSPPLLPPPRRVCRFHALCPAIQLRAPFFLLSLSLSFPLSVSLFSISLFRSFLRLSLTLSHLSFDQETNGRTGGIKGVRLSSGLSPFAQGHSMIFL